MISLSQFHAGVCQDILFPGWTSTNAGQMVGACVVVFIAAALYEGLKCWRDVLFRKGLQSTQAPSQMNITKQECGPESNCSGQKIVKYVFLTNSIESFKYFSYKYHLWFQISYAFDDAHHPNTPSYASSIFVIFVDVDFHDI